MHAEIKTSDALIMLGQAGGPWKPSGGAFYLWVETVDEVYTAGPRWRALRPEARLRNQPYGHRNAGVVDPCGLTWWIASPAQGYANRVLRQQG